MGLARELLFDCPHSIRIFPRVNNGTAPERLSVLRVGLLRAELVGGGMDTNN